MRSYTRRPEWLKLKPLDMTVLARMRKFTGQLSLHTVCDSALCPNRMKCFSENTATFMILGDICTRNCTFCGVTHGKPLPPDPQEPKNIVVAVEKLRLRYVVITSVTRDDLPDGGALRFAQTVFAIRKHDPTILVEILVPDFQGSSDALKTVIDASPAVLNHNIETVPRLYTEVRPQARYDRSIELLTRAKSLRGDIFTKSGMMLGLGETKQEVIACMSDLRQAGCDFLTIGQYLQPTLHHHSIVHYVLPEEFEEYGVIARRMGFTSVSSGPLVRSSFHAADHYCSGIRQ